MVKMAELAESFPLSIGNRGAMEPFLLIGACPKRGVLIGRLLERAQLHRDSRADRLLMNTGSGRQRL